MHSVCVREFIPSTHILFIAVMCVCVCTHVENCTQDGACIQSACYVRRCVVNRGAAGDRVASYVDNEYKSPSSTVPP